MPVQLISDEPTYGDFVCVMFVVSDSAHLALNTYLSGEATACDGNRIYYYIANAATTTYKLSPLRFPTSQMFFKPCWPVPSVDHARLEEVQHQRRRIKILLACHSIIIIISSDSKHSHSCRSFMDTFVAG